MSAAVALLTLRTLRACSTSSAGVALLTLRTLRARSTSRAAVANITLRTLRASCTSSATPELLTNPLLAQVDHELAGSVPHQREQ